MASSMGRRESLWRTESLTRRRSLACGWPAHAFPARRSGAAQKQVCLRSTKRFSRCRRARRHFPIEVTRIVLIHVMERSERSNTGRHIAAALSSLELRVFGLPHTPLHADDLQGAWLLWPGESPLAPSEARPSAVVVLDGSWSQARKMMQRVPQLRSLRKWSLPTQAGRRSLRATPPGGMSTLEAVAEAVAYFEGDVVAAPLRELHESLVQKQLAERGYVGPHRGRE